MSISLAPGTRCVFNHHVVQIDGSTTLSTVSVRVEATGEIIEVPVANLMPLPSDSVRGEVTTIPSDEWERCKKLAMALELWRGEPSIPTTALHQIAGDHQLSARQIQRLMVVYRRDPRTSSLVRRRGGRPRQLRMLHPEVEAIIQHVIEKHYLVRERVSQSDIIERARSLCRRCALSPPCVKAVRARIKANESYAADARREGAKAARQRWQARPGKLHITEPLAYVQIDHTLIDVMVLSDARDMVLGRPWLSIAIDIATRVVLGMHLTMDAPSSTSVSLCIAHTVLPKTEDADDPGIWPIYGKPQIIHADNGKDLVSAALKRGCEQHAIDLRWRPLGKSHYGGHIERMMGTLMRLVHGLPGTTFSNVKQRGDYPSEARATMTLDELRRWLVQKIGRYYHVRKHRMLGVPPLVAWERAWTTDDGQVLYPEIVSNPQMFRLDFLPYVTRRLQRTGVQYRRSRYWSDALTVHVHPKRFVKVHYHSNDPSRVWVRVHDDRVIEARAFAGPAAGEQLQGPLDLLTSQRMDDLMDCGYARCEHIERVAAHARNSAVRMASNKTSLGKQNGKKPRAKAVSASASPAVPLNRKAVVVRRSS